MDNMKALTDELVKLGNKYGLETLVLASLSNYAFPLMTKIVQDNLGNNIDNHIDKLIRVNEKIIEDFLPDNVGDKDFNKKFVLIMALCTLISGVAPELSTMSKSETNKTINKLVKEKAEVYEGEEKIGTLTLRDLLGYDDNDIWGEDD